MAAIQRFKINNPHIGIAGDEPGEIGLSLLLRHNPAFESRHPTHVSVHVASLGQHPATLPLRQNQAQGHGSPGLFAPVRDITGLTCGRMLPQITIEPEFCRESILVHVNPPSPYLH